VLVHEATYTVPVAQKIGPVPQHSTAQAVAEFAQAARLPNLVLTHFSARYQDNPAHTPSIADVEAEARACYGGRLFLARDLESYRLDKEGLLTKAAANG
jgi:ribonuclease Z